MELKDFVSLSGEEYIRLARGQRGLGWRKDSKQWLSCLEETEAKNCPLPCLPLGELWGQESYLELSSLPWPPDTWLLLCLPLLPGLLSYSPPAYFQSMVCWVPWPTVALHRLLTLLKTLFPSHCTRRTRFYLISFSLNLSTKHILSLLTELWNVISVLQMRIMR